MFRKASYCDFLKILEIYNQAIDKKNIITNIYVFKK